MKGERYDESVMDCRVGHDVPAVQCGCDSNNLANVNTTAYKKNGRCSRTCCMKRWRGRIFSKTGNTGQPAGGSGAVPVSDGPVLKRKSGNRRRLDFAIDGDAFYGAWAKGQINYTRDGNFHLSMTEMGKMLTTADGYPVLDELKK